MKKKAIWIAAAVVVIAAAVLAWASADQQKKKETISDGSKAIKVEVIHSDGSERDYTFNTDASTLEEVLQAENLISGDESSYGLYVTEVDGEKADYDKDKSWWKLSVNGEDSQTGVSDTVVEDGTIYTWSYVQN